MSLHCLMIYWKLVEYSTCQTGSFWKTTQWAFQFSMFQRVSHSLRLLLKIWELPLENGYVYRYRKIEGINLAGYQRKSLRLPFGIAQPDKRDVIVWWSVVFMLSVDENCMNWLNMRGSSSFSDNRSWKCSFFYRLDVTKTTAMAVFHRSIGVVFEQEA